MQEYNIGIDHHTLDRAVLTDMLIENNCEWEVTLGGIADPHRIGKKGREIFTYELSGPIRYFQFFEKDSM